MVGEHLPRVRELSLPAAIKVSLWRIGSSLRFQYEDLLEEPLPPRIAGLVQRLA